MEPIKPIPPETVRLAGLGMQREVAKIEAIIALAKRTGFPEMIERTIRQLARLVEARSIAPPSHGSMKVGPSEDYLALLRGEITSEEYVERLKATVDERHGRRGPVTMATAAYFEANGQYELAEIARKYAVDRPRWWHRFTRRSR